MAQKDKIKELVGRSLNSYHTKSLQQMDRIEKKNKEQNHKISILSNELDNDYLTKTEEGSVVSLEHSKEGMVYLDELQGNTLVNYCTDGSKELTLNGDIDVEGTFVTTTEGVDNGKVDIMCEGNTLVNLVPNGRFKNNKQYWLGGDFFTTFSENDEIVGIKMSGVGKGHHIRTDYLPIKQNTEYTLIYSMKNTSTNNSIWTGIYYTDESGAQKYLTIENYDRNNYSSYVQKKIRFTTLQGSDFNVRLYNYCDGDESNTLYIKDVMILEGDWTNKEVPSEFFEGMKSVGQDDENGHSIEIEAKNKNLLNVGFERGAIDDKTGMPMGGGPNVIRPKSHIRIKPNTTYAYTRDGVFVDAHKYFYDINKNYIGKHNSLHGLFTSPSNAHYFKCYYGGTVDNNVDMLEEASVENPYVAPQTNKKSIPLNEPLRGLPSGVKDRFVKQGGKWYIERNCAETYISVPSSGVTVDNIQENRCRIIMANYPIDIKPNQNINTINLQCDKIPSVKQQDLANAEPNYSYGICTRIDTVKGIYMWVTLDKMPNQTLDGFKEFINNNQPKIVYELATPIYEPLEIEPTLNTYNDLTHISNNSIIPCNMKIKNSGYNAIIKPSTLYTVALDTNKSGTIGMNLGGAKGTTTNNVLKLTTPATLTDDSLRLYGKGIKGSRVRLLEGDKTNWIPSYFEGMKSSFEDKFDATDNTYKMEILSNNKNLFKGQIFPRGNSSYKFEDGNVRIFRENTPATWGYQYFTFDAKPNTTYTLSVKNINVINGEANINITEGMVYKGEVKDGVKYGGLKRGGKVTFKTNSYIGKDVKVAIAFYCSQEVSSMGDVIYENIQIEENSDKTDFINNKSNKIQFSSIEPLRGVGDIKDRFVFKDGKLMIERNVKELFLNNNYRLNELKDYEYTNTKLFEIFPNENNYVRTNGRSRLRCSVLPVDVYTKDYELFSSWDSSNKGFMVRLNKNIIKNVDNVKEWIDNRDFRVICRLAEPTYEEIPFELQKIILEGYENGTLFFDTNIPPTSTVTYAGETPIVKSVKLNKTEVLNNTNDINDNIIPYLMDMDYRVVCLQLQSENINDGVSMARLFGGAYEMLQRDIQSKRYSVDEYKHRLDAYLDANKITEEEYNKLGDMLNE